MLLLLFEMEVLGLELFEDKLLVASLLVDDLVVFKSRSVLTVGAAVEYIQSVDAIFSCFFFI